MSETVVDIERVPLNVLAAASPDRAERVARRLRDAVGRALPGALAAACGRELDADDAYVFVERLEVQCAVATHWADDTIAARLAERIARALLLERRLGHALVFRDRAEFLSAFVAALLDGQASARWWFAEFAGLAPLPVSASVRTLVIAEGAAAWEALARLSSDSLRRVLAALAPADAERILVALAAAAAGPAVSARVLIDALEGDAGARLPSLAHRLIAGLVQVTRAGVGAASAASLLALQATLALRAAARDGRLPPPAADAPAVLAAWFTAAELTAGERAAVLDLEAAPLVDYLAAQAARPGSTAGAEDGAEAFGYTPFGGALLLCVVLVRAGWWAAWRDALRGAGHGERADALAAWLALAVVARALSPQRPAAVERDPLLRRVFGVPDDLRPVPSDRRTTRALCAALALAAAAAQVRSGRRHFGPRLRAWGRALLAECGRRIPGCAGSSPGYLRTQCLSLPAAVRGNGAAAQLGCPPLDVLLVFSGLKRASVVLPDGRGLALGEEASW